MRVTAPDDVYLPAVDAFVESGDEVDVPPEIGESLVDQGWTANDDDDVEVVTTSPNDEEM